MQKERGKKKKEREKANPTNLNRDLGQGRRGARHEKKSLLHFSWGQERRGRREKSREWEERAHNSATVEARKGGKKGNRLILLPSRWMKINTDTVFLLLLLSIPAIDGFSSKKKFQTCQGRIDRFFLFSSSSSHPFQLHDFRLSKLTPFCTSWSLS